MKNLKQSLLKGVMCLALISTAWLSAAQAEDINSSYVGELQIIEQPEPDWTLSITEDGQLMLNKKAVDKMSDPEIKATMKKLFEYLDNQNRDRSLVDYYDRQTGYLLERVEALQKELTECQKANMNYPNVYMENPVSR